MGGSRSNTGILDQGIPCIQALWPSLLPVDQSHRQLWHLFRQRPWQFRRSRRKHRLHRQRYSLPATLRRWWLGLLVGICRLSSSARWLRKSIYWYYLILLCTVYWYYCTLFCPVGTGIDIGCCGRRLLIVLFEVKIYRCPIVTPILVICQRQLRWNWILSLHRSCKIKGDNNGDWNIPKWKSSYPRQAWSVPLSPVCRSLQNSVKRSVFPCWVKGLVEDSWNHEGLAFKKWVECFLWNKVTFQVHQVLKSWPTIHSMTCFVKKRTWDHNNQEDLLTPPYRIFFFGCF